MSDRKTTYSAKELLQSHALEEPLVVGGVRCHGGFDQEGIYVSPRTLSRVPAISAWKEQRKEQFSSPILDVPLDRWREYYPNVAQSKFLLSRGIRGPVIAILTRIGLVERMGAMIRYAATKDLQQHFDEDIRGTALWHLDRGLFEAHARDEAGYGSEAGHSQMWFAVRDIAFEQPLDESAESEKTAAPITGRALTSGEGKRVQRLSPDVDFALEIMIGRMVSLLLVEIAAFRVFHWAEALLSDSDLVAGYGLPARLVSYIRTDESPHVEYLKVALSEIRDRTLIGESGRMYAGRDVVGPLWERAVSESLGSRQEQNELLALRDVERAIEGHARADDLLEQFHELGSVKPDGA